MRQWTPSIDMNFDGVFTIGDVGLWFNWLFFLPGDWVVRVCLELFTPLGTFFEMNPLDSYGGTFSGVFSGILWVLVIYGCNVDYKENVKPKLDEIKMEEEEAKKKEE